MNWGGGTSYTSQMSITCKLYQFSNLYHLCNSVITNGSLSTSVYRKATNIDRILHNDNNHPTAYKISCICALFIRIDTHCSTSMAKSKEWAHLYWVCTKNGYSMEFVWWCNRRCELRPMEDATETSTWMILPYITGVSEAAGCILSAHRVKVVHKPKQTLRTKLW